MKLLNPSSRIIGSLEIRFRVNVFLMNYSIVNNYFYNLFLLFIRTRYIQLIVPLGTRIICSNRKKYIREYLMKGVTQW